MLNKAPSITDLLSGGDATGGKKSQRSIVPISHMKQTQEQMQHFLQK